MVSTLKPRISIIVPAFNSADIMKNFFESCLASNNNDFEIIINDEIRSTDKLEDLCNTYSIKGLNVIYIRDNQKMAQGRKSGARQANGEFLLHLDSDMEISPFLIDECLSLSKEFDALVIPEESFGTTFWARCKWLEKKCYEGVSEMESLRFLSKDIYDKLGGHDVRMIFSEDKDLDLRVRESGYAVGRTRSAIRHNEGNLTLRKTLQKKMGYSGTANIFAEKHPEHYKWQTNAFNRYLIYFKNIKYLLTHPIIYLGLIYMKTAEFAGAAYGLYFKYKN